MQLTLLKRKSCQILAESSFAGYYRNSCPDRFSGQGPVSIPLKSINAANAARPVHNQNRAVFGYLNGQRLASARDLLVLSHQSIAEISYVVGYENLQHFTAVFMVYDDIHPF